MSLNLKAHTKQNRPTRLRFAPLFLARRRAVIGPGALPIVHNEAAKRWSVTVKLGGTVGDKKLVGVLFIGKNAQLLCGYYDDVLTKITVDLRRQFDAETGIPGIRGKPSDWKECDRIAIRRTS